VVDEPVSVLPQATIPNRARQVKISIGIGRLDIYLLSHYAIKKFYFA
jgi:hypothetical protein